MTELTLSVATGCRDTSISAFLETDLPGNAQYPLVLWYEPTPRGVSSKQEPGIFRINATDSVREKKLPTVDELRISDSQSSLHIVSDHYGDSKDSSFKWCAIWEGDRPAFCHALLESSEVATSREMRKQETKMLLRSDVARYGLQEDLYEELSSELKIIEYWSSTSLVHWRLVP